MALASWRCSNLLKNLVFVITAALVDMEAQIEGDQDDAFLST